MYVVWSDRAVNSQKSPVVVISRLKKVLGLGSLDDILQDYTVNGGHVRHNCIFLNKSGIVTNIQLEGRFAGFMLTDNFQYFTVKISIYIYWKEKQQAVRSTCCDFIWLVLITAAKTIGTERQRESVCIGRIVCVCVCSWWGREQGGC